MLVIFMERNKKVRLKLSIHIHLEGAKWLSGRVLDLAGSSLTGDSVLSLWAKHSRSSGSPYMEKSRQWQA